MEQFKAIEVRRVPSSADLFYPGEFAYIPKRERLTRDQENNMSKLAFFGLLVHRSAATAA